MVIIGILGCFIIIMFSWIKLRDILAPPFIISAIWLLMYVNILIRSNVVDISSFYYISFFIGLCFFITGFFLVTGNKNKANCKAKGEKKSKLTFNPILMKLILLIIIFLFIVFSREVISFVIANYSYNFWQTLSIGRSTDTYNESLIISYARIAIIAFTVVCGTICFSNPSKSNKLYLIISLIMSAFFVVTAGNRGIILTLIISIFFSYMIIKNYSNTRTLYILLIASSIMLIVFISFAFMKFVYEDQSDTASFIISQLRLYFSTSLIAFVEWIQSFHDYSYGSNTFSFFLSLLNSVGYDVEVPSNVQEFVYVYGDRTNVYTILHYYAHDFGLIYAFIIQFVLGMIHGFLYKKSILFKGISPFFIALQSLLYFPLINQFFDDKYFSILSTWIQYIFWIWLFTRNGFLITEKKE